MESIRFNRGTTPRLLILSALYRYPATVKGHCPGAGHEEVDAAQRVCRCDAANLRSTTG